MAQYRHLPIYKATYDLLVQVTEVTRHFPRDFKTFATRIREEVMDVVLLIYRANSSRDERAGLLGIPGIPNQPGPDPQQLPRPAAPHQRLAPTPTPRPPRSSPGAARQSFPDQVHGAQRPITAMQYLYYTYVDAQTRIPCLAAPMRHGPDSPAVAGLQFGFALESQYPTQYPVMYGTCPDDSNTDAPGVLGVIDEAAYQQALADELTARRAKVSVSMRQARLAMLQAGLLDQVDAAIAGIAEESQRRQAEINWEYATTVERLDGWVRQIGVGLGLSEAGLDGLFERAMML